MVRIRSYKNGAAHIRRVFFTRYVMDALLEQNSVNVTGPTSSYQWSLQKVQGRDHCESYEYRSSTIGGAKVLKCRGRPLLWSLFKEPGIFV